MIAWLGSALAIAILAAWGARTTGDLLGENRAAVTVPAGMVFGPTVFAVLVNLLGRATGVQGGALVVLAGMASWTVYRGNVAPRRWTWGTGPGLRRAFVAGALLLVPLGIVGGITTWPADPEFHVPLVATIANGNLPVRDPFAPELSIAYHFGADLCAGALASLTGLPPWQACVPVMVTYALGLWGLVLALGGLPGGPGGPGGDELLRELPSGPRGDEFGRELPVRGRPVPSDGASAVTPLRGEPERESPLGGILAAILVFFGAGFRFAGLAETPFGRGVADAWAGRGAWPDLGDLAASVDFGLITNEMDGPAASSLWSPVFVPGYAVLFVFLLTMRSCLADPRPLRIFAAGLLLGAAELFRGDLFVLALPATALLAWLAGDRAGGVRTRWRVPAAVAALGIGLAIFQGAVVTSMVRVHLGWEPGDALGFAWKHPPHWVVHDWAVTAGQKLRHVVPGEAGWTGPFLRDAAPAFLLLLPATVWAAWLRRPNELFAGLIALCGWLAGLFVDLPREPRATVRLFETPLANFAVAGLLADLLGRVSGAPAGTAPRSRLRSFAQRAAAGAAVWAFVAVCALPPLGWLVGTVRYGLREAPLSRLPRVRLEAGRWLRENVPIGVLVGGLDPLYSGHFDGSGYAPMRKWKYPRHAPAMAALARADLPALAALGIEIAVIVRPAGAPALAETIPPGMRRLATFEADGERAEIVRLR